MSDILTQAIRSLTQGFILVPLALGVFLSYRILRFPDLTVDGSYSFGAILACVMIISGFDPVWATLGGMLGGALAGLCSGFLMTRFGIQKILAGILVTLALYSLNFLILGKGAHAWTDDDVTLYQNATALGHLLFGTEKQIYFFGLELFAPKVVIMYIGIVLAAVLLTGLILFFRTRIGLAMRAVGENPSAVRAMGANVSRLVLMTMVLSNALVGLSGALFAQTFYGADTKMGLGQIIVGLACVLLGDAFFNRRSFSIRVFGAVVGAILFNLIIALILMIGDLGEMLNLLTAVFVFLALVIPRWLRVRAGEVKKQEAVP